MNWKIFRALEKLLLIILLKEFRSVKNIGKQSLEELERLVGKARAKIVYDYFTGERSPRSAEYRAKKMGPG